MPSGPSVGIITLTFSGDMPSKSQVLRPIANASPSCDYDEWLTSSGDAWECVDDVVLDGDLSYIYVCGERNALPIYENFRQYFELGNCSMPTGATIDYVRTMIAIKNLWHWCWTTDGNTGNVDEESGYVRINATVDDCITVSSSPSIDLVRPFMKPCVGVGTNYNEETAWLVYNYTLTSNPSTGLPWTETTVNDLVVGIIGRADRATGYFGEQLQYGADEYVGDWDGIPPGSDIYSDIDDNDDGTYAEFGSNLSDPSFMVSVDSNSQLIQILNVACDVKIDAIDILVRAKRVGAGVTTTFKIAIKHGGVYYYSPLYTRNTTSWVEDTWALATRPWDGQPWEASDLDSANTWFGISVVSRDVNAHLQVSELELLPHGELAMGEVRCTQIYSTVVYHEVTPTPCRLPKPVDIKVNQDIDTTGLNFWSGNRDVFAEGRSSKRTTLSGIMWDGCTDGVSTCEDVIHCIRALGKLQQPITIAGLRYADLNVEYNILSFSWKQQSECTNIYDWDLELEFTQ